MNDQLTYDPMTPEHFNETAMADRYNEANNGKADLKPTLEAMMNAISNKNSINDPEYEYLFGVDMLIEYILNWACGKFTDKDLLQLIDIRVRATQADVDKKATEVAQ